MRGVGLCAALIAAIVAVACHPAAGASRVRLTRGQESRAHESLVQTSPSTGRLVDLSESARAAMVICHDTLGRPANFTRVVEVSRCSPCVATGVDSGGGRALAIARQLWAQRQRAPYDALDEHDMSGACARLAYDVVRAARPLDDSLLVEYTLFRLADMRAWERWTALAALNARIEQLDQQQDRAAGTAIVTALARGVWERAQRQLERPIDINEDVVETRAHELDENVKSLRFIPTPPPTSGRLGISEAGWVAQLFTVAAQRTDVPTVRSALLRLALAPWATLHSWNSLDSAAHALLQLAPRDSAVLPAIALAAYKRIKHPVEESPLVMRLFDEALAALPRADSVRYDSFDGVLAQSDDQWRYGFLANDRAFLETRGWSVVDPLWTTPVNEIRLARRARVTEADYRYADIAPHGTAGSETPPGQLLQRLGAPYSNWRVTHTPSFGRTVMTAGWPSMPATVEIEDNSESWHLFYGNALTPSKAALFTPVYTAQCPQPVDRLNTLLLCALTRRAEWNGVPFYGTSDTIDVTLARFRAPHDSADVYIGARVPLRAFSHRDATDATAKDRITVGAWLTSTTGTPIFHHDSAWTLPKEGTIASYAQWRAKSGSGYMMHRVEAMEPSQLASARGVAQYTSDSAVTFLLRGFGLSDILVAKSARLRSGLSSAPARWSDLVVEPNGGVVLPLQTFAIAFEMYDLRPDANGRVRWRVELRREHGSLVSRDNMRDALAASNKAGSRVLAVDSDVPDVSYTRDAVAAPATLESINFGFSNAPVGRHVLNVRVTDLVSGQSVSRSVSVRILAADAQQRGTFPADPTRR